MTNEEAIKQLNGLLEYFEDRIEKETDIAFDKEEAKKDAESLRMGVESLKRQPKKGQWKPGDPICPCCGEDKFKDLVADIWADWQPAFCPNCGAKMKVKEG